MPIVAQSQIVIVMVRLEANGVKRGHAFGDIGDSLGGRAKLRSG